MPKCAICRETDGDAAQDFANLAELNRHRAAEHGPILAAQRAAKRGEPAPDPSPAPPAAPAYETPPVALDPDDEVGPAAPPRRGWRERVWARRASSAPARADSRGWGEKAPKQKRVSTADVWEMIWGLAGTFLVKSEADGPVGRCMQYQAPVAGEVLNDALADTVLDKVLQPFARKADKLEAAAAVLALPILVAVVERNPEMAGPLELPLRAAVQAHLVAMAPAMKRQQAKDKKVAEAAASLGLDKGPDGETLGDPVGVILDAILRLDDQPAGPQAAPEPAPAHVA